MARSSLSGCPRCRGWLQSHADSYGTYRSCLQCGYVDECVTERLELPPEPQKLRRPQHHGLAL
jgi:hypothetical protein